MWRILYWLPRIASVVLIVFISLFALDVFGEPNWPIALFMHLIPSYFLTAITMTAWKYPLGGGMLFLLGGVAFLIFTHFAVLILAVPIFLIGGLFLTSSPVFRTAIIRS